MRTLQEIKTLLSKNRSQLFKDYPIKSIAIFGSVVRNEMTPESDVDFIIEFNDKIGIRFIDLADELEKYLGVKVDLVTRNGIKDRYFEAIKSDLIYV